MVSVGDPAPSFTLETDDRGTVSLADFKGQNLVLYFYPKDDTSGCTKEAIAFSEAKEAFAGANTVILGVSKDSIQKHEKFRDKHDLTVHLGADIEGSVVEDYGVWVEKSMYGKKYMGIERATYLIDGKGIVREVWRKVRVPGHVDAVLKAAEAL